MAGSDRPRNPFGIALPHIAAGIALTGMSAFMSAVGTGLDYLALTVILFLVSFVWSGGLYYVVISLYNHSFKLDKNNWIAFGSVLGGALLVYLTCLPIGIN